jgi:hypothetical protein
MYCAPYTLPINLTEDKIQTAPNRDDIAHLVTTQQFRQDLQVDERWATYLGTPGILAAIADEVYA